MSIYTEKSVSKYIAISRSNDLSNLPDSVQLNIKYALFRAVLSRHSAKDVAVGIAQIGTELAKVRGIHFRILLSEPCNCRFFEHFRQGIASWSSLLQRRALKQKIEIMGELNASDSTITTLDIFRKPC